MDTPDDAVEPLPVPRPRGMARFDWMTQQDKDWHAVYERSATPLQRADIGEAFTMLCAGLRAKGYTCASDARANTLLGAIARFLVESQQ